VTVRVLLTCQAEPTHMLGMVPLAWALRARGHDVRFAGQPGLRTAVLRAGLPFAEAGADHRFGRALRRAPQGGVPFVDIALTRPVDGGLLDALGRVVTFWWRMVNEPMLGDLVALCRRWRPDLVVWEETTFAGAVAAAAVGAPHARFVWGVDLIARLRERLAAHGVAPGADPLTAWLAARADQHGAAYSADLVLGGATLACLPASLRGGAAAGTAEIPLRYVPYNGPAEVPAWLRAAPARPRVCLTLGASALERFDRGHGLALPALLAALDASGVETVAALPAEWRARLTAAAPASVRLTGHVPLHALLAAGASAVVHHGGAGTAATALVHGVPQLLVPDLVPPAFQFDEEPLARALAGSGAATVLTGAAATPEAVAAAAVRRTAPAARRGAARMRARARAMPAPAAAAARLEAFAAGRAPATAPPRR
jgi:hypothetical protein